MSTPEGTSTGRLPGSFYLLLHHVGSRRRPDTDHVLVDYAAWIRAPSSSEEEARLHAQLCLATAEWLLAQGGDR